LLCNPRIQADKEIEDLHALFDVVTIYLGEKVIPAFKEKKIGVYHKII